MIKPKYFIFIYLTICCLGLFVLPTINFVTDYSRIISKDYFFTYKDRRENNSFLKVCYLLEHQEKFDSVIFGSSRVRRGFDTRTLHSLLGGDWFKMESAGGVMSQHLHNLRALTENNYVPRQIVLTIDDFNLWKNIPVTKLNNSYNRRAYPLLFSDWLDFYRFYLFKLPTYKEWEIVTGSLRLRTNKRMIGENNGRNTKYELGSSSKQNNSIGYEKKLLNQPPHHGKAALKRNYSRINSSLRDILEFVDVCKLHKINLILVYPPSHYKTLISRNIFHLERFKKSLAGIKPFFDFSSCDDIAMDNRHWLDVSHYSTYIGDKIVKSISRSWPEGHWGSFVTAQNVDKHLATTRTTLLTNLSRLQEYDKNIIVNDSLKGLTESTIPLIQK